jgi:PAS domain S-box-containing protein
MISLFLRTKLPPKVSIPVKITAIYFAVGILWILFSDAALGLVVRDPSAMTKLSIAKGCLYVSLTAFMLYLLVRRWTAEITRDIAQLKQTEQALQDSEANLNRAQEIAHIGSWHLDIARNQLTWSNEVYRLFGRPRGTVLSYEAFLDMVSPEDREHIDRAWAAALQRAPYDIEHRILVGDELKWVRERAEVEFDPQGKAVRADGTVQDITARKQAEQEVALLSFALDKVREAAFLMDDTGRFQYVNEEACRVLGYPRAELIGLGVSDIDPDFPEERWPDHWRDLRAHRSLSFEGRHRAKDGRIFPVELNANYFEYGDRAYNLALVRDVTERRAAEEARSRLAAIVESSYDGILSKDLNGTIMSWNAGAERLYGYSASEATGKPVTILMPPGQQDEFAVFMRRIKEGARVEHYETKRVRKDGGTIDVSLTLSPIRDHRGQIIGASTIARDISAQKRVEEERRQSAERFRAIADYTYDWEYWIGVDGNLLWVNPAVERITGYSVGECMGMPDFPIPIVAEVDRETVARQTREAVQGSTGDDLEFRVRHKDGRLVWVAASWQPIYDSRGTSLGHRSSIRDIAKRKQAQEALQRLMAELELRVEARTKELSEANQSLEAANRELESFSYSVSHDLRAPLRAIDGFSKMVLKGYADRLDDEGRRKLNVIRSNAQQMDQLINDLLAFSRLGRKEMVQVRLDMEALVQRAWKELTLVKPDQRIRFSVQGLPHAMGDQTLIKEAVANLLSNAIKFSKFRETAAVEVGAYPEEERNVYYVRDNGAGFDMQYYDKLFGVFQRLHSADEFEGTGVGLAIVERIIRRHGGRVWAEGKVGEGATFYFTLARKE